jgi:acetoin utilization deacetylase AcuC-like enzyme
MLGFGSFHYTTHSCISMIRTGIVRDDRFNLHRMSEDHPEHPERLLVLYRMLDEPGMKDRFIPVPSRPASDDELLLVHSARYINRLKMTEGKRCTRMDRDTQTCATSHEAALLAAGGLCEAVRWVCEGRLDNAFAMVRPPGHHAEKSCAKGFCLYNNVAVAARYAQTYLNLKKILIVDWDLHHGNGTHHIFENDPTVLYFSVHQFPHFPGTGKLRHSGKGPGRGYSVNIPVPAGLGDGEYLMLLERLLKPVAAAFSPDLVLVSAGFDLHRQDPLGGMFVTAAGFAAMTRLVLEIADQCCSGRLVLSLEGGYDLQALRNSVKAVRCEMAGLTQTDRQEMMMKADRQKIEGVIREAIRVHGRYWKVFPGEEQKKARIGTAWEWILAFLKPNI